MARLSQIFRPRESKRKKDLLEGEEKRAQRMGVMRLSRDVDR